MSAKRFFPLFVVATLVAAFTAQAAFSGAKSISQESKEQIQREYELGERHAEMLDYIVEEDLASLSYISRLNKCFDVSFSELANCCNELGERYSQTP